MKQLHQQIPRKRKNLACRCLLVAKKEFSYWIWNKIITNNARNNVNWNVNKLELSNFYPTDLVNTITTIPLRICWSADHWAYRSQSPYSAWQRQWRGFRPIGVGEVIRRIIGKCVTRVAKQDVINASGAMQVCAGQKSGGEAAIHAMRNIFEADETDAALLVDASNAFNSLNRAAALNNIRVLCPLIATYVTNTYAPFCGWW